MLAVGLREGGRLGERGRAEVAEGGGAGVGSCAMGLPSRLRLCVPSSVAAVGGRGERVGVVARGGKAWYLCLRREGWGRGFKVSMRWYQRTLSVS